MDRRKSYALGVNRLTNWNSKLSRWNPDGVEKGQEVLVTALNTI